MALEMMMVDGRRSSYPFLQKPQTQLVVVIENVEFECMVGDEYPFVFGSEVEESPVQQAYEIVEGNRDGLKRIESERC
ncbi:unnamed protein product [Lupinus luteus]|uniref:Uncharacterized protein n=1 Tax=Lupinus luteus TaxID=3873 RepID=A0AAV1X1D4_LUPLU